MTRVMFFTGTKVVWGAELSLLTLAEHAGMDSRLITSHPPLAALWRQRVGTEATEVRASAGRIGRLVGFIPAAMKAARSGHTIVIFDFYLLPIFVALRPLIALRGGRLLVDVHDARVGHPRRRPYFWMMRWCSAAICISRFIQSQVPTGRTHVIYRPIAAPSTPPENEHGVVGVIGQVAPEKRIVFALRAIARVDGVRRVVLRGSATQAHADHLREVLALGHELFGKRFDYQGRVPAEHVMDEIDVLVATNPNEPFGRVVAEAQLANVVAVAPASGGASEAIEAARTGFTYAPDDESALADAIRDALDAPQELRDEARRYAAKHFDPRNQALKYAQAILG